MQVRSIVSASACALLTTLVSAGCGREGGFPDTTLGPAATGTSAGATASSNVISLPFDAARFAHPKANSFFPLVPGMTYRYRNVFQSSEESNLVEVTHDAKMILGVRTTVVHDRVFLADGSLSEDTFDWYAADHDGNVWYFGEDTKEYD